MLASSPPESEGRSCKHEKVYIANHLLKLKKNTSAPGFYQPKHPFQMFKNPTNLAHVYLFKCGHTVTSFQQPRNLKKSPTP